MKKVFLLVIFILAISLRAEEDTLRMKFGVYGEFNINSHSADFKKLPDCPNCSPGFESGSGTGISFGALFEYPFSKALFAGIRVGLTDLSAKLTRNEATTLIVNGVATGGTFEHQIEATLKGFSIQPLVKYAAIDNLYLTGGIDLTFLTTKDYSQFEKVVGNGTFLDANNNDTHEKFRNQISGELKNAASMLMSPFIGISYELPMNAKKSLLLEPTATFLLGLNNIVDDETITKWKSNAFKLGLSLKYSPEPPEPIIEKFEKIENIDTVKIVNPDIIASKLITGTPQFKSDISQNGNIKLVREIMNRTDTLFVPKTFALSADVTVVGVNEDGKEFEINTPVKIEEFSSNKLQPLLNYIFFDENSAEIAGRYVKINSNEAKSFTENKTYPLNTLETYYHLLNIVGSRMTAKQDASLSIVGCNDDEAEKANKSISAARAETVKNYLVNVWGIDSKRLNVSSRNLPNTPSKPLNDPEKMAENRRVELSSDDYDILKPVMTNDTLRVSNPKILRFKPSAEAEAGLKNWNVSVMHNNKLLKTFNGNADLVSNDWTICSDRNTIPNTEKTLDVVNQVIDNKGQKQSSKLKSININQVKISDKRKNNLGDKEIDNFSLILFEFDKSEIKGANKKIMDIINKRIQPNSTIQINGYTDRTGEADYNKNLSQKRANEVKTLLKRADASAIGVGEDVLLYNNDLPEGRFYCRIVTITLETPITK